MDQPLYKRIEGILRDEIRRGKYRSGDALPSSHELARTFSVSRNTTVRVLDNLVRTGTALAIRGSGTIVAPRPAPSARKKARRDGPPEYGILLADFDDVNHWYIRRTIAGINARAKELGCRLTIHTVDNEGFADFLDRTSCDGLLVVTELPLENIEMLQRGSIPFVLVGNDVPGMDLASVHSDGRAGFEQAFELLYRRGRRRFAVFGGPLGTPVCRTVHAYCLALKNRFHLEEDALLFRACGWGMENGRRVFQSMLEKYGKNFDALIAGEDYMAWGAIRAARENGMEIPKDMSVIGSGDYPMERGELPLTTISSINTEAGGTACSLLHDIVEHGADPCRHIYLKTNLIIREDSL